MQHSVILHGPLTKARFGYSGSELSLGSHKPVIVECQGCHRIIEREFRYLKRTHQCPIVEGDKKWCFSCKSWKDLSLFNKCSSQPSGVAKLCRECYNSNEAVKKCERNRCLRHRRAFLEDIGYYFRYRTYAIKKQACKHGIPFDLDEVYLFNLWKQQEGKCYYSSLLMRAEGKVNGFQSWFSPSLDRKIPSLGYVKGNVAWCCFGINSCKQTMNAAEFLTLMKNIQWRVT